MTQFPELKTPEDAERFGDELRQIFRVLRDYYGEEELLAWLFQPHVRLGGRTPAEMILRHKQAEILRLFDPLDTGADI